MHPLPAKVQALGPLAKVGNRLGQVGLDAVTAGARGLGNRLPQQLQLDLGFIHFQHRADAVLIRPDLARAAAKETVAGGEPMSVQRFRHAGDAPMVFSLKQAFALCHEPPEAPESMPAPSVPGAAGLHAASCAHTGSAPLAA
jgi:hypothetical protein